MFRGISLRHIALLLFGPMLAETLSMFFTPWFVYQATNDMGLEPRLTGFIPAAGAAGYALSAYIAGRWVTAAVAPWLMLFSLFAVAASGLIGMAVYEYWAFVICAFGASAAIGHYYTPFQIHMTHVQPFRTLAYSVAFYNIAWGTGAAIGPLVGSSLSKATIAQLTLTAALIVIAHTLLNIQAHLAPKPSHEAHRTAAFQSTARQRWYAMLCFAAAAAAVRGLYMPLWPGLGKVHGWSDVQVGLGQFAIFAPLPFMSLLWARIRHHLVEPWIMLASMAIALVGFALIPLTDSWPLALVLAFFTGIAESCVVFHAIYYINADPDVKRRSRNVGVFEMMAGLTNVAGPLLLGTLAWNDPASWRPYTLACLAITAVSIYIILSRRRPDPEISATTPLPASSSYAP